MWRVPRTTMVDPKVSPKQTCMLERFSVVHMGELAHKSTHTTGLARGTSLPTSQSNSVKRVSLEPLPPEQPRAAVPYSQWRRRYDNDTCVCMYVFIKLHITTQSGPVILVCMYVCVHLCMVITYNRVWINRVRLPILLVVS